MTNIVMLCRGRLRLSEQALNSLFANTDPDTFNLTVVSDSEDDFRITRLLRSIQRKNFMLIEVSGSSHVLSQLKNTGVAASEQRFGRGDWLYLSDNDVWFSPGWLEKLTTFGACFEPNGYRLFGGQIHPFHQPVNTEAYREFTCTEHQILDGPSWLMRWRTWDKYGPFDRTTAPGVCQSEEYPFCQRLLNWKLEHDDARGVMAPARIGAIRPFVVEHTGIRQTDGKLAPGAEERMKNAVPGVLYL